MTANPRAVAAMVLASVLGDGESLQNALAGNSASVAVKDRALLQELCYGTLRWAPRLEFFLTKLLQRSLRKREPIVHCLLLCGLYQLLEMRVPAHAVIDQTVEATRTLGKSWSTKMVNAVLRRMQREQSALESKVGDRPVVRFAHPAWMIEMLQKDWPNNWQAILEANNKRAPMTLRVNPQRLSRERYLERLRELEIKAFPLKGSETSVSLEKAMDVNRLPGFQQGEVSVQDAAAQLAAGLLDLAPGQRLLDACAAPGGKTGHILETETGLEKLVAVDIDSERLDRVAENLARLGFSATLIVGDARDPADWWDGQAFDRILLDAPCTASGVIRRHPDIKLLRRESDLAALVTRQAEMLDRLWPLLAPAGKLIYVTCSVYRRENADQVTNFITRHDDAVAMPIVAEWGKTNGFGRQVLPGEADMDGFFYACLVKQAA